MNDSLINTSSSLTRSNDKQEKVDTTKTDIVEADVYGAIAGGTAGAFVDVEPITKPLAIIAGGVICGAITSIAAAIENANKDCDGVGVVMKSMSHINYSNSLLHYDMIELKEVDSLNTLSILPLPKEYVHLGRIGIMHNKMVDFLWKGKTTYSNLHENRFIPKDLVRRKKYEKEFNDAIQNCLNWKTIRKDKKSNIGIVINSFMSVYSKCVSTNNKDEALKVLNAYLELVNKRKDLTEKKKGHLISGFCVAWYSFVYWSEELHWK